MKHIVFAILTTIGAIGIIGAGIAVIAKISADNIITDVCEKSNGLLD